MWVDHPSLVKRVRTELAVAKIFPNEPASLTLHDKCACDEIFSYLCDLFDKTWTRLRQARNEKIPFKLGRSCGNLFAI
jgi:hypothetical protein